VIRDEVNFPSGFMNYDDFKEIIKRIKKVSIYINLYLRGEPFLNPQIFSMIKNLYEQNIFSAISTNSQFLDEESCKNIILSGLNKIIIPIEGWDEDSYVFFRRNGSLKNALKSINYLSKYKKELKKLTPIIEVQTIVFKSNEWHLDEIKKMAYCNGCDVFTTKTAYFKNPDKSEEFIPSDGYSRYLKNKNGEYSIKRVKRAGCWKMWSTGVILWDGNILPCCYDKKNKYILGNILKNDFENNIFRTKLSFLRKKIVKTRKNIDICGECTEH